MNAAIEKDLNPRPFDLSVEICLRFNLRPLRCLNDLIDEIFEQRQKDNAEYIRRLDSRRPDMLVSSICSASIHNFRENQSASSHLPVEIWNQK